MKYNDSESLRGLSRDDGMRTPEGYFADFARRMEAALPEQPWEKPEAAPARRTLWNVVRPYVYMAAMFAGIWCMMNIFNFIHPAPSSAYPEGNSTLAAAINDDAFINDYFISEVDQADLFDRLYDDGFTPASLKY